jgi:hypothetical protein
VGAGPHVRGGSGCTLEASGRSHSPLGSAQRAVVQGPEPGQGLGVPLHTPATHLSLMVQALPVLHFLPSRSTTTTHLPAGAKGISRAGKCEGYSHEQGRPLVYKSWPRKFQFRHQRSCTVMYSNSNSRFRDRSICGSTQRSPHKGQWRVVPTEAFWKAAPEKGLQRFWVHWFLVSGHLTFLPVHTPALHLLSRTHLFLSSHLMLSLRFLGMQRATPANSTVGSSRVGHAKAGKQTGQVQYGAWRCGWLYSRSAGGQTNAGHLAGIAFDLQPGCQSAALAEG